MKKFFSKRSGFTLVEILVAFVIFAIFATMIMEILRLAIAQRSSNNEFAQSLVKQEEILAKTYKDVNYDSTNKASEKLEFDFYKADGSTAVQFDLDYEVRDARGNKGDSAYEGINYFLSDVEYDKEGTATPTPTPGKDTGEPSTNSGTQASRMDTRITGTRDITKIKVHNVVKDTSTEGLQPGQVRYYIEVSADAGDPIIPNSGAMADEDVPYAQYRMYFYSATELDTAKSAVVYKEEVGGVEKEYTKKVYQEAKVVDIGYLNSTELKYDADKLKPSSKYNNDATFNTYTVQKSGTNGIRIGSPFVGTGIRFDVSKFTRFYVVFDKDPGLTTASFGANGTDDGYGSYEYSAYPIYDEDGTDTGETHVNIYGAYEFEKVYK